MGGQLKAERAVPAGRRHENSSLVTEPGSLLFGADGDSSRNFSIRSILAASWPQ